MAGSSVSSFFNSSSGTSIRASAASARTSTCISLLIGLLYGQIRLLSALVHQGASPHHISTQDSPPLLHSWSFLKPTRKYHPRARGSFSSLHRDSSKRGCR